MPLSTSAVVGGTVKTIGPGREETGEGHCNRQNTVVCDCSQIRQSLDGDYEMSPKRVASECSSAPLVQEVSARLAGIGMTGVCTCPDGRSLSSVARV